MADFKYYRSHIAGLHVITGKPKDGEVAPEHVRFEAYEERVRGDKVVVGYLKTDSQAVIAKLAKDGNVEQINQKEYDEATDAEKGAKRAAV